MLSALPLQENLILPVHNDLLSKLVLYRIQVIREKKRATGAGADRLSQGMSMSFGKPVSVAARINEGTDVFEVKVIGNAASLSVAKEALKRASSKISGHYSIIAKPIAKKAG